MGYGVLLLNGGESVEPVWYVTECVWVTLP
jgi:hypothetical protein